MIWFIENVLPWFMSCITIYQIYMTGNKHPNSWIVMLVNQCLWLLWIIVGQHWGLILMNIALWVVAIRNHRKWNSDTSATTQKHG